MGSGLRSGNKTLVVAGLVCGLAMVARGQGAERAAPAAVDEPAPVALARGRTPPVPAGLPQVYAVMTFENRSGYNAYDWMNAAVPFVLGEKLELHPALRPGYGALVVGGMPPHRVDGASVAAFARDSGATWVWTGWINRLDNWDLELGVSLWRVSGDRARRIDEVVGRGDFSHVHRLTGDAIVALSGKAGLALDEHARGAAYREPTGDHYAFTLFGRGLAWLSGTLGWVDLGKAEHNLSRASFIDPSMAETHRVLGELYARTGKPAAAQARFDRALSARPDYYAALVAQSAGEHERGNFERVRDMSIEMVHQRPWDLERRYLLGQALWETGDIDDALIELDRVVSMRPRDVRAHRIVVLIKATKGKVGDLVDSLQKVAALDPGHVPTRLDLAAAYTAAGRDDDARAAYRQVLALDTGNALALKFLGDLSVRQGDQTGAIDYYRRATRSNPRDPRPFFALGALYVARGDDRNAQRIYRAAQRFTRYRGEVESNLGAIAYREGNLHEALWYLRRAVRFEPGSARVRYNLALALSAFKDYDGALEHIAAGLGIDPGYIELAYLEGVVELRRGHADDARAAFQRVLALRPMHADARHNLTLLDDMTRRASAGEVFSR